MVKRQGSKQRKNNKEWEEILEHGEYGKGVMPEGMQTLWLLRGSGYLEKRR